MCVKLKWLFLSEFLKQLYGKNFFVVNLNNFEDFVKGIECNFIVVVEDVFLEEFVFENCDLLLSVFINLN